MFGVESVQPNAIQRINELPKTLTSASVILSTAPAASSLPSLCASSFFSPKSHLRSQHDWPPPLLVQSVGECGLVTTAAARGPGSPSELTQVLLRRPLTAWIVVRWRRAAWTLVRLRCAAWSRLVAARVLASSLGEISSSGVM